MSIENLLELNTNSYIMITVYDQANDCVICCNMKHELDPDVFPLEIKEWGFDNDGILIVV